MKIALSRQLLLTLADRLTSDDAPSRLDLRAAAAAIREVEVMRSQPRHQEVMLARLTTDNLLAPLTLAEPAQRCPSIETLRELVLPDGVMPA